MLQIWPRSSVLRSNSVIPERLRIRCAMPMCVYAAALIGRMPPHGEMAVTYVVGHRRVLAQNVPPPSYETPVPACATCAWGYTRLPRTDELDREWAARQVLEQ